MEKLNITDNKNKNRFETDFGDDIAYLEYRHQGDARVLVHTYIPEQYRGKGNAVRLIREVLDMLRQKKEKVMIHCPSVTRFLRDNPDYNDVVKKFRPVMRQGVGAR